MTPPSPSRRRVVVTAPGVVEVVTEPQPAPGPDEAVVTMVVSGVCGSDKAGAGGTHAFFSPPYHPGHEVVGVVAVVGPHVHAVAVGDRVTAEPTMVCGRCAACSESRENLCANISWLGCGGDEGGMADTFTVRADRLHHVPEAFTDDQAAMIEPFATPLHAARIAGDLNGRSVAVLGAGTIGLLCVAAARRAGARVVVATDPVQHKRELALRIGADGVVDASVPDLVDQVRTACGSGDRVDVVFDCVAAQSTVAAGIAMAAKGGTVVVVGGGRVPVSVDLPVLQEFEVRLQGSSAYCGEDFTEAIRAIGDGALDGVELVTARYPLSRAAEAFEAIGSGQDVKILVTAEHAG